MASRRNRPPRYNKDESLYPTYWDKSMCIWRDPDDYIQSFWIRTMVTNPLADLKMMTTVMKEKISKHDGYQVLIDVCPFRTEEIRVKVNDLGIITIAGRHEEREDEHGFISRHFIRTCYLNTSYYNVSQADFKLTLDGILTITAPELEIICCRRIETIGIRTHSPDCIMQLLVRPPRKTKGTQTDNNDSSIDEGNEMTMAMSVDRLDWENVVTLPRCLSI